MAKFTFSISVGALVRGQVRREIKRYCFEHKFDVDVDEDKGLFESLLNVTMYVPDRQVNAVQADFKEWMERWRTKKGVI